MDVLQITPELAVTHVGPSFDKGRLPAIFYFALSAKESLELDPYNQPIVYLKNQKVRLFSFDLPAHGENLNALDALSVWAQDFRNGKDPLTHFFDHVVLGIEALISRGLVIREKIGSMGLSRGGFAALHVAAKTPLIRAISLFAPMIDLSFAKEFESQKDNPVVSASHVENQVSKLYDRPIKLYIGNRDIRVGTTKSFALVEKLAEKAYANGLRSPPIEMVVSPSIGHLGHGTSKEIFHSGADFLERKLGIIR